jgi:hypothetical protein
MSPPQAGVAGVMAALPGTRVQSPSVRPPLLRGSVLNRVLCNLREQREYAVERGDLTASKISSAHVGGL